MKVFSYTWDEGKYGDGLLIVAANNWTEADSLVKKETNLVFYNWHRHKEMKRLSTSYKKPQIIIYRSYQE